MTSSCNFGGKPRRAVAARTARKIVVYFPEPIYARIEKASLELATSRNALIRLAVERFLDERELVEAYQASAKLRRRIAQDFSYADAENIQRVPGCALERRRGLAPPSLTRTIAPGRTARRGRWCLSLSARTKRNHPRFGLCARAAVMIWSIRRDVSLSVPLRRDSSAITRSPSGSGTASRT
jgi:hypothetical protein